jgi:uncharacterized membrane protein YccC
MKIRERFAEDKYFGVHLAVNVFVGTSVLWVILGYWAKLSPIWAISSMIAALDPHVDTAFSNFRARLFNTLLGCAVGILFLALGGEHNWKLPLSMTFTVLLSSYFVRIVTMWRQAPITAAIVMSSVLTHHGDKQTGLEIGLRRVGEVILGCVVGLLVTWAISKVWPPPEAAKKASAAK